MSDCSNFRTDLQIDGSSDCRIRSQYHEGKGEEYDKMFQELQKPSLDNTQKVTNYLDGLQQKKKQLTQHLQSKHSMLQLKKELEAQTQLQIQKLKRSIYFFAVVNILIAGGMIGSLYLLK